MPEQDWSPEFRRKLASLDRVNMIEGFGELIGSLLAFSGPSGNSTRDKRRARMIDGEEDRIQGERDKAEYKRRLIEDEQHQIREREAVIRADPEAWNRYFKALARFRAGESPYEPSTPEEIAQRKLRLGF